MKKGIILTLLVAAMGLFASAQGRMEMRFNEVMTQNDSNLVDQTGHRSAWVEIFNRSYGTVGMEQMFISNQAIDLSNLGGKKPKDYLNEYAQAHPDVLYEIPRGDVATKVAPRTHIVFFADGQSSLGALHLSFKIQPGQESNLYLYDVNGDLVDMVTIPASLPANSTFALKADGQSELIDGKLYVLESPNFNHQTIIEYVCYKLRDYVKEHGGNCLVRMLPQDTKVSKDERTIVQPDLFILCDRSKITRQWIYGAPDFVMEVLSKYSRKKDTTIKFSKYMQSGVKEYWIIDPKRQEVLVYDFEGEELTPEKYTFADQIPIRISGGKCSIDFAKVSEAIK